MNFNTKKIIKLYKKGFSIRGICRKLNMPEWKRAEISNLLLNNNIKIRKGKLGIKVGSIITETCPLCKKEKKVKLTKLNQKPRLCVSCALKKSHKNNPRVRRHEGHYNWKGGVHINGQGYIVEYVTPKSPYYSMANSAGMRHGGYILQHRLVMARHLGRCLRSNEVVHHKTGNKQDNSIENLALYTRSQHKSSYQDGYRAGYKQALIDKTSNEMD